jgi:Rad3-related DNA helicase
MNEFQKPEVTLEDVRPYFPLSKPRPGQLEACQTIIQAYLDGHTDVIVDAPTGTGKSAIAVCVSRFLSEKWSWEGFITTPLKTLQNQYDNDAMLCDYFTMIKGRNAYPCSLAHLIGKMKGYETADEEGYHRHYCSEVPGGAAKSIRARCKDTGTCEFYDRLDAAINSRVVLNNTSTLIYQQQPFAPFFEHRDFVIMDECHQAENTIMGMFSFTVNEQFMKRHGLWTQVPPLREGESIDPNSTLVRGMLTSLKTELETYPVDDLDEKKRHQIESMLRNINTFSIDPTTWVCDTSKAEYTFKPLYPSDFAYYVTAKATKLRVFMSATILDHVAFAESMDLDMNKVKYIRLPSTFPVQNSPVFHMTKFGITSLNYKELDVNLPKVVAAVDEILSKYPNCKGIIHTHTNKIANHLQANCKLSTRMMTHTTYNREDVLKRFMETKQPMVLVSPSMVEGIDLKDEYGRFQIIVKVPYPFLGDAQIKARTQRDPNWYQWKTTLAIVQACGRIMRHEKDWGHTYVLDPDFLRWARVAKDILPEHFKKSVKWHCNEIKGPQ